VLRGNGFNDDVNTVERVAHDDFPAGNIQITVAAKRVPATLGAQKYALVVQGSFSGVLASAKNPAAAGKAAAAAGAGAGGECVVAVPAIDRGAAPGRLSKERAVSIPFAARSGAAPGGGFQCKLSATTPAPAAAAALAHDWRPCVSPATYTLADGQYTFQVSIIYRGGDCMRASRFRACRARRRLPWL
jgi:hypothetical protein